MSEEPAPEADEVRMALERMQRQIDDLAATVRAQQSDIDRLTRQLRTTHPGVPGDPIIRPAPTAPARPGREWL